MVAQEGAPADIERILSRLKEEEALVLELRLGLRGQAVHNVKQVRPPGPGKQGGGGQAPA
jgi:DNA-directed RNA polymerase sigma subunit (sigma70/sigma32)